VNDLDYAFHPLGDQAVMIELGKDIDCQIQKKVMAVSAMLDNHPWEWMVEYVPAFTTVCVYYNPLFFLKNRVSHKTPYEAVCDELVQLLNDLDLDERRESRVVEIPVHYGGESGPDLDIVAKHNGLTPEEVVAIHSNGHYFVNMIGFAPGFPYIGGMSEKIATPRKSSPRLKIPAGSVGIAGKQTGIYPIETPGGWQIIGKTPLQLFRPDHDPPSLLKAGDKICFKPITLKEFREWE
jgi:inhibitor of KinA